MQRARGTQPHSSTNFSVWEIFTCSLSSTLDSISFFASSGDKGVSLTSFTLGSLNNLREVTTKVTLPLENIFMSFKSVTNSAWSPDSRTSSALSRMKVILCCCCLLQFRSQCWGFSGGWKWFLLQVRIIEVATSFTVAFDPREQNKTIFSERSRSLYPTLIATDVFPNPGPPVITTMPASVVTMGWIICSISCERP